ncbi:STAS domain-containing protein [Sinobaca sp. H24]|uniref:STAS domain-containing protein n=1 Tax=Sinobaca sp. H24 TaxID=2923376 RepID=UPI00207A5B94|nr:STAS domain-containing protein [Sinobaca sp. H24]
MHAAVLEMIYNQRNEINENWSEKMNQVRNDVFKEKVPKTLFQDTNEEFVTLIFNSFDVELEDGRAFLRSFAEKLIRMGWPLSYFTKGMQTFRRVVLESISSGSEIPSKKMYETFYEIEEWVDEMVNQLVDEYSGSWESTLHQQRLALKELSAPLIPVFDNISVMPLIGTIDTERAKLIMENLLDGIIEHRSQVVLIDITGVPVVDTMVAHHIIQASEAVRLVGAECILVGIRPEIAQTIVNLGIDLGKFPTKSSLRKGIETGMELTKRQIINV